jgi:hypothetical protein
MANMSYCQFENTYHDLAQCIAALEEHDHGDEDDKLSSSENRYRMIMRTLCEDYIEACDEFDRMGSPEYRGQE